MPLHALVPREALRPCSDSVLDKRVSSERACMLAPLLAAGSQAGGAPLPVPKSASQASASARRHPGCSAAGCQACPGRRQALWSEAMHISYRAWFLGKDHQQHGGARTESRTEAENALLRVKLGERMEQLALVCGHDEQRVTPRVRHEQQDVVPVLHRHGLREEDVLCPPPTRAIPLKALEQPQLAHPSQQATLLR
eukprot:scaffold2090_cov225-Prasinococcus_capsulatus_cf.AAC.16